jgi:hypothetical protein
MTDRTDRHRRANPLKRPRSFLDRHARACAKMNEHLAVALAIIVTLTAACRAPALFADHAGATQMQE